MTRKCFWWGFLIAIAPLALLGQSAPPKQAGSIAVASNTKMGTTADLNRRLQQLVNSAVSSAQDAPSRGDYHIGPNDQLAINVLEAPDLSVAVRVTADGNISLPLLGTIRAAGMTPRELALVLQALLRRSYMKDPQVTVTVIEMQSHSVSVLGAVQKPGVFQVRGTKTLLEMLSMAGGLATDAGDAVLVMRGASAEFVRDNAPQFRDVKAAEVRAPEAGREGISTPDKTGNKDTIEVSLKRLLDSGDPRYNVPIYPGDIIKVKAAGIVYVVGDVHRPGGYPVKDNEHITVLQVLALGEGLAPNAAKSKAKVIRIAQNGEQVELPVHLGKILSGKSPDLPLHPRDILFVPKNGAKAVGSDLFQTMSRWIIWKAIP
ncbi:MAG: polysaccharide export protein [Acidobacteriota bacterium]